MIRAAALATVALALLTHGCATVAPRTESIYFIEGARTEPIVLVTTPAPDATPLHTAMTNGNDSTPWD